MTRLPRSGVLEARASPGGTDFDTPDQQEKIMSLITRVTRKHDDSRSRRRLAGLATAVASAAVVAGGVMLPAAAATAAPMHPASAVSMTPRHDHHDGDYWDNHDGDHWEHHDHWHYYWDHDHHCYYWVYDWGPEYD
jgi:hypothetical protein